MFRFALRRHLKNKKPKSLKVFLHKVYKPSVILLNMVRIANYNIKQIVFLIYRLLKN